MDIGVIFVKKMIQIDVLTVKAYKRCGIGVGRVKGCECIIHTGLVNSKHVLRFNQLHKGGTFVLD